MASSRAPVGLALLVEDLVSSDSNPAECIGDVCTGCLLSLGRCKGLLLGSTGIVQLGAKHTLLRVKLCSDLSDKILVTCSVSGALPVELGMQQLLGSLSELLA